jgi:hypothetical protein
MYSFVFKSLKMAIYRRNKYEGTSLVTICSYVGIYACIYVGIYERSYYLKPAEIA